jgi:hypothetical protein
MQDRCETNRTQVSCSAYRSSENPAGLRLGSYSGSVGIFTVLPICLLLRDALEPATLLVLLLLSADLLSTAFFHWCSLAK